jgi:hypothetical protein
MPADHDLDPPSMTEEERLSKRRYEAWFAFETDVAWLSGAVDDGIECLHLSVDDPITQAQLLTGIRPREWTVRCEDCGRTWVRRRKDDA